MTLHLGKRPATPSAKDFKLDQVLDVELVNQTAYKPHDTGFPHGAIPARRASFIGPAATFWRIIPPQTA